MPVTFAVRGPVALPSVVTYVGPGESPGPTVVSDSTTTGWRGWWGVRAFTAASIPMLAIRIRDSTTTTETDISTTTGGGLNPTQLSAALPGGHSGTIVTFYDQTGLGNHLTNATAALQPAFVASAVGGKPGARFNAAHALACAALSGSVNVDTRFSFLAVAMSTGSVTSIRNVFIGVGGGNAMLQANNSSTAHIWGVTSSAHTVTTATDSIYHTAIGDLRATTDLSTLYVDGGAGTSVDIGNPFASAGGIVSIGALDTAATSQPLTGDICECGVYNGNITSFVSALDSNMSGYYTI